MAKQKLHLTAFVASPSDVLEERETLEAVIHEINQTMGPDLGAQLDLIRWETHAYPDSGPDAQSVVTRQLGDNYDIFIGILWHRFGTPTPRADSGTAEEFERAHKKYQSDPESVGIMFYFKTAPPASLTDIDPDQLVKVNNFKSRLGAEGHLYWSFKDSEDFARFLRMHLPQQMRARMKQFEKTAFTDILDDGKSNIAMPDVSREISPTEHIEEDEDEGLFDLIEIYEDNAVVTTQILERIAAGITALGSRVTERTELLESVDKKGGVANKKIKSIANQVAMDMEQFAASMEVEVPLYSKHQLATFDALGKAILIQKEFVDDGNDENDENANELVETLVTLKATLGTTSEQITSFYDAITASKRFTTVFNRAKRRASRSVKNLLEEIDTGIKLITEALKFIRENVDL